MSLQSTATTVGARPKSRNQAPLQADELRRKRLAALGLDGQAFASRGSSWRQQPSPAVPKSFSAPWGSQDSSDPVMLAKPTRSALEADTEGLSFDMLLAEIQQAHDAEVTQMLERQSQLHQEMLHLQAFASRGEPVVDLDFGLDLDLDLDLPDLPMASPPDGEDFVRHGLAPKMAARPKPKSQAAPISRGADGAGPPAKRRRVNRKMHGEALFEVVVAVVEALGQEVPVAAAPAVEASVVEAPEAPATDAPAAAADAPAADASAPAALAPAAEVLVAEALAAEAPAAEPMVEAPAAEEAVVEASAASAGTGAAVAKGKAAPRLGLRAKAGLPLRPDGLEDPLEVDCAAPPPRKKRRRLHGKQSEFQPSALEEWCVQAKRLPSTLPASLMLQQAVGLPAFPGGFLPGTPWPLANLMHLDALPAPLPGRMVKDLLPKLFAAHAAEVAQLRSQTEQLEAEYDRLLEPPVEDEVVLPVVDDKYDMEKYLVEEDFSDGFVTTCDSWNRLRDKARVEHDLGISERGDSFTEFVDPKQPDVIVGIGYRRVLFGDHGPYIEFETAQVCWEALPKVIRKGQQSYYDEHYTASGYVKAYEQKRTVRNKPNPPPGKWSVHHNRRDTGYSDYQTGVVYMAVDNLQLFGIEPNRPGNVGQLDSDAFFQNLYWKRESERNKNFVAKRTQSFDESLGRSTSMDDIDSIGQLTSVDEPVVRMNSFDSQVEETHHGEPCMCGGILMWSDLQSNNPSGWECKNSADCSQRSATAGSFRWFCRGCRIDFCESCYFIQSHEAAMGNFSPAPTGNSRGNVRRESEDALEQPQEAAIAEPQAKRAAAPKCPPMPAPGAEAEDDEADEAHAPQLAAAEAQAEAEAPAAGVAEGEGVATGDAAAVAEAGSAAQEDEKAVAPAKEPPTLEPAPDPRALLQKWAERVTALAGADEEMIKRCRDHTRKRIMKAHVEGNLMTTNWDEEPVPSTVDELLVATE